MNVTLIHNPEAGKEQQSSGEELTRLVEDAGHTVRYQSCKRAGWREILDQTADLVAIAGGDGIVGAVARELVGRGLPATILPMGTANNIAAALELRDRELKDLVAAWTNARRIKFDVCNAKGPWGSKYFFEGIGIGAFADTMSKLDARKNIDLAHHEVPDKKIESVLHIMRIRLDGARPLALKLNLDGVDLSGEYVLLEAMNIRSIGPNLQLAADANPGDGLIDVVLVADHEREKLGKYLAERITGKSGAPALSVRRGRHLRIESDEVRLHIDDDIWPEHGEHPPYSPIIIDVELHPESLEILVPS
jgi:diacylglycerol kinase (ATP)